ncbi:hypothetical protein CALVIDRAFT_595349 [Calocera viscosa TUFC12733]|uniref:SnoaL-like domain-containing protein n=1 Tax=Calocera viscosa (strain TUFC12733) TaxID=1330018 RepID=A0A167R507_CALVF|nr:hypothetical protein CALVIDRAFT_595349 [Calocera viscosa TUFC12733]
MDDIKKPLSTRTQLALEYLRASEIDDKEALARMLSENYERTVSPLERPDIKPGAKKDVLTVHAWREGFREIKATPMDVMETLDGRVVLHIRWRGLRNDGQWVQKEEIRTISFTDGPGLFDDLQIVQVKVFIDWVGFGQWKSAKAASNTSMTAMYNHAMGLDLSMGQANAPSNQGSPPKCIVM